MPLIGPNLLPSLPPYAQCRDAALAEPAIGAVGLEIESHLVDLDHVADPVPWKRVEAIAAALTRA
jgi:glutamate--cysteine ligase